MNLLALLAYLFKNLYFGVRSTKVFDTFGNSLILLNIIDITLNII